MSEIQHVTDENFENQVINAELPTLVDFWAEWCGPCKAIAPVLDEIAADFSGKLNVVKVNVDENSETPVKYGVRGIPYLVLIKEGNVIGTKVGSLSKSQLTAFIDSSL